MKICNVCKKNMIKPKNYSYLQWDKKIYCSNKCRANQLKGGEIKRCIKCQKDFYCLRSTKIGKYCSKTCSAKNTKNATGKHIVSEKGREKMRLAHLGKPNIFKGVKRPELSGEKNPAWVFGNYKKQDTRNDSAYQDWRKKVWVRDGFKCKVVGPDCSGRLEAHHILGWTKYPELRYEINNGITLCHAHHPRKRSEEAELSPYFQQLVAEMK